MRTPKPSPYLEPAARDAIKGMTMAEVRALFDRHIPPEPTTFGEMVRCVKTSCGCGGKVFAMRVTEDFLLTFDASDDEYEPFITRGGASSRWGPLE